MKGHITQAVPAQSPALYEIIQRVIDTMHKKGLFQWDSTYPSRVHIDTDIELGQAWVYEYENNPVAYIVLNESQAPEYATVSWQDSGAHSRPLIIHRLFVDPDFEGQGIAHSFLDFSEKLAKDTGFSSIRLDAYHQNARSCALYSKSAYTICGTVYFANKGPFYCFEKVLDSVPIVSNNFRILSIGCISVDIKAFSYEDTNDEAYRDGTIDLVPGGVARGMAINLSHLGFSCALLSVVGNDIFGDYLCQGLTKARIDTTLIRISKTKKTALFSVMASHRGDSSCIYCNDVLTEISVDHAVIDYIRQNDVKALVIDSNVNEKALSHLYEIKKELGLFVFQNATAPDIARKALPFACDIDLFTCNEFEAAAILGYEAAPDIETAHAFVALGFKNIIATFGAHGVMVHVNGETWIEKPYTTDKIIDTIGAGDAFASGFLYGFLHHKPVKRCIQYGLASAKETLATRQTVCDFLSADMLEYYPDHTN